MLISERPDWKENKEVILLTKYGKTILGEWNTRTQTFMSDGWRESDFEQWKAVEDIWK